MTAQEWYIENYPEAFSDLNLTGHDDDFMFRMMEEYASQSKSEISDLKKQLADMTANRIFDYEKSEVEIYNLKKQLDASQSKWVSCAERLPEIGQEVLCYYEIEATDIKGKKTGEIYTYKKILHIESITTRESSKQVNWIDSDYNPATPTHWQPLTDKPVE